jgi:hypothetical protein
MQVAIRVRLSLRRSFLARAGSWFQIIHRLVVGLKLYCSRHDFGTEMLQRTGNQAFRAAGSTGFENNILGHQGFPPGVESTCLIIANQDWTEDVKTRQAA